MPATATLGLTTLAAALGRDDQSVLLASTSGVVVGQYLYVLDSGGPGELMFVRAFGPGGTVLVNRGQDGTRTAPHSPGSTVYVGRGDQFYRFDPSGQPMDSVLVSPWINTRTGGIWFPQGDSVPTVGTQAVAQRWWQLQTPTFDQGPLGVRTTTLNPTSGT